MKDFKELEIMREIKKKNTDALEELMKLFGKLVYFISNSILTNEEEKSYIDECYNDVFIAIWENSDCFDEEYGNLKGWIVSITKYKALDIKRNILKNNGLELINNALEDGRKPFEKIEIDEIINNAFKYLKEEDKNIFIKRYLEGYSIKEIAIKMNVSENYLHARISRARKKLQAIKGEVI